MSLLSPKKLRKREDESGQSTLEFIFTLFLMMGLVLFFLQGALIMAYGNFVHYATYMSARTLLSSSQNPELQRQKAEDVIAQLLKKGAAGRNQERWPGLARGIGGGAINGLEVLTRNPIESSGDNYSWQEGVRYTFKGKLFLQLPGLPRNQGLELTSESWLGREPTFDECLEYMSNISPGHAGYFDNGC